MHPWGERLNQKYSKTFKSTQVKVIVWTCFMGGKSSSLIVCDGGMTGNEYEDLLFDRLFSLINDLVGISEDSESIQITNKSTFICTISQIS